MAQKLDFNLPYNDLRQYIPQNLRNGVVTGLLDNLFNRFMTKDESVPFYGFIGQNSPDPEAKLPRIPQLNVERDVNGITPVFRFSIGAQKFAFTFQDLINRAKLLGVSDDLNWFFSQGNNFAPPVDFDKFANYYQYYWIGKNVGGDAPTWNAEQLPEYYVIARPKLSDTDKLNVITASLAGDLVVLTGSGFLDQVYTLTFLAPDTFTISTSNPLTGPGGTYTPVQSVFTLNMVPPFGDPFEWKEDFVFTVQSGLNQYDLLKFSIVRELVDPGNPGLGYTQLVAGDSFTVTPTYFSSNYTVSFTGSSGKKPKVTGVNTLREYQSIQGVQLYEGARVLITQPTHVLGPSGFTGGIFIVTEGTFEVAPDFDTSTAAVGARVFDRNSQQLFSATGGPGAWSFSAIGTINNMNDWQESNFWVNRSELAALGLETSDAVQAQRPIIEYAADIRLNKYVNAGSPAETGTFFLQTKTEFNQVPLFDLYRYDGTHSGLVSSVFFYEEDQTAELDLVLQRRIKRTGNVSDDPVFNHGCIDENGHLLFFKRSGELKTVWHAGYLEPTALPVVFGGTGSGNLTIDWISDTAPQEIWTVTAISPTTFKVESSKLGELPAAYANAVVGVQYQNYRVHFTINGSFNTGDTFVFAIGNLERPRYVYRNDDGVIFDFFGGPAADIEGEAAWQAPRQLIHNPYNDIQSPLDEGSVQTHFRSVLSNQLPGQPIDYSFGGNIKLWGEQQSLLASLLMQKDLTIISMIDLAKQLYSRALNTLIDIYIKEAVVYFSQNEVVVADGSPSSLVNINELLDYLLSIRANDLDVRTVLFDSTSGVTGFPVTLPQLGLGKLSYPYFYFDPVLGRDLLIHHDGHGSVIYTDTQAFRQQVISASSSRLIMRSDGTETPVIGSYTSTPPANPYKGELWSDPTNGGSIKAFAVDYDATPLSIGPVGSLWWDRDSQSLFESNGFSWVASSVDPWVQVNFADNLNQLLLTVERRLWQNVNPNHRTYDLSAIESNPVYLDNLKREFFLFAVGEGLDALGSNYVPTDAFTWNYSQAVLSNVASGALSTPAVPARWHHVLVAHQETEPAVIPTERPNTEPWKLFGYSSRTAWELMVPAAAQPYDTSASPANQIGYTAYMTPSEINTSTVYGPAVRVVDAVSGTAGNPSNPLNGLQTIDGVNLQPGDLVLIVNDVLPNCGIWQVSSSVWTRPVPYNSTIPADIVFTVMEGALFAGSRWVSVNTAVVSLMQPVVIAQVRDWTTRMWQDLQATYPALRLSVDPTSDALLPPYVSPSSPRFGWSITEPWKNAAPTHTLALTGVIPIGISAGYEFGESSPVEEVWVRSIEYGYAQAKAFFQFNPFEFLGFTWGFNWVEVDGILYDSFNVNMPGHQRFVMHGEKLSSIDRTNPITATGGSQPITIKYDGYEVFETSPNVFSRYQNFTVRDTAGGVLGYVREGVSSTVAGWTILIEDRGVPFRIGDTFSVTTTGTTFTPAEYHQVLGFGQVFVNALRDVSVDSTTSYAVTAFREWDVQMGHRAGGMVSTQDLRIFTADYTLSQASYELLLKKNEAARSLWIHGLRVTVSEYGTLKRENGVEVAAPAGDASDWVFRIEGYNLRYLDITYYTFNTSGPYVTFKALDASATQLEWRQYTEVTGEVTTQLPITVTGLQNCIDIIFGYVRCLEDSGWTVSSDEPRSVDAETGRTRTWQLDIEKLIDRIYSSIQPGEGVVINPFFDRVWLKQESGMLAQFSVSPLFDPRSHTAVYDVLGNRIPVSDLRVSRGNLVSSFGAIVPMFSAHAQLDEYEHLIIFSNYIQPSTKEGLLYDPFSGSRVITYGFAGRRQAIGTLRPEFGGYFISGGSVLPNVQASTDSLQNAYDTNRTHENELVTRHALALLGFTAKDYFSSLDISKKTQFNFWRGLVQYKGTNLSFDAYLNNDRFKDAKVDEFWAYKVAEYGDARQKEFPELKLQVNDCLQQFTQLQFDASAPLPNFTQVTRYDESRWFSIDDLDKDTRFLADSVKTYTRTFDVSEVGKVITLPFIADALVINPSSTATINQVNDTSFEVTGAGLLSVTGYGADGRRYSPVKLINYDSQQLIEEIPLWHPAAGIHTPLAIEGINIISAEDPARYNYSTLAVNNNNFDPLRPWGERELGRVWFDTTKLAYVPYFDKTIYPSVSERLSRWGSLADYASVDVYEWVKSSVPPAEYNALALETAGNVDIDAAVRASGEVALPQYYYRDRVWYHRPIAWSNTRIVSGVHPTFYWSNDSRLSISGSYYYLEQGTFAQFDIVPGMRIGIFDNTVDQFTLPVSEAVITDALTKVLALSSTIGAEPTVVEVASTTPPGTIRVETAEYTDQNGQVDFSVEVKPVVRRDFDGNQLGFDHNAYLVALDIDSGTREEVLFGTSFEISTNPVPTTPDSVTWYENQELTAEFTRLGLRVTFTFSATGSYSFDEPALAVEALIGSNLTTHDAAVVQEVVPVPFSAVEFSNDSADVSTFNNGGWAAWYVPTQQQLDTDSKAPNQLWKAFLGELVAFTPTAANIEEAVAESAAPLTLNSGEEIKRYSTEWTDWIVIKNTIVQETQLTSGPLVLTSSAEVVDSLTTVYVNGAAQLRSAYSIDGTDITVNSVPAGSVATALIRGYTPTTSELEFNPAEEDDISVQRHYKQDYEYVVTQGRDQDGNLSTRSYYFWVRNKTTPANGKKLSVQSMARLLREGPANYLTFQNTQNDSGTWFYDALTISGLTYVVTKDDTFKLRFTRDFTLRDDPDEIALKNTHVEWGLIRPGQTTRIPERLWQKLIDSTAGEDAAGNAVPALKRVLYDERNGTSTRFGFNSEQTLAPSDLLTRTLSYIIVNTQVKEEIGGVEVADYIDFVEAEIDLSEADTIENTIERALVKAQQADEVHQLFFSTPAATRETLTKIWAQAKVEQVNELFFACLEDVLASNQELTDIFKTSRLSLYSIQEKRAAAVQPTYE